jgi:hypothetical protein
MTKNEHLKLLYRRIESNKRFARKCYAKADNNVPGGAFQKCNRQDGDRHSRIALQSYIKVLELKGYTWQ